MSKRTHFTTVTPLPAGITRQTVLDTLHNHVEMIDLNPLVIERHPIKPPREAAPEEINCLWYSVTDKVNYIPGLYQGKLTFNACFNDLPDGMQSHIYAPMGLDMRGRWSVGGSLPGEPRQNVELGHNIPKSGLYLREDVDMKVNFTMTAFVKKTTKRTHTTLVERLIEKSHSKEGEAYNSALTEQLDMRNQYPPDYHTSQSSSGMVSPSHPPNAGYFPDHKPPLDNHPSFSSHGSIPQHGMPGAPRHPSYHAPDPKQGYIQPAMGVPPPNLGVPQGFAPQNMGSPQPMAGYPHPGYAPYPTHTMELPGNTSGNYGNSSHQGPNQLGTNFSVELPSDNTKSPVEIAPKSAVSPRPYPE